MRTERQRVLVVGAGLAGLATGVFLGMHGIPALVVERHAGTSIYPKARGQYPHTMETLKWAGVDQRMVAAAPVDQGFRIVVAETMTGPVRRAARITEDGGFAAFSAAGWGNASQERAEPILAARAEQLGTDLRFRTELESFDQDADGVTAVIRDLTTGERTEIRADYLVGADGHRGAIRPALGIGVHGPGVLDHGIGVVFRADVGLDGYTLCYLRNPALPGGTAVAESTDGTHRYAFYVGFDPDHDRVADFTPARWVELIRVAAGIPDLAVELVEGGQVTTELAARVADRFSAGRVHLIGDAVRVMPPTGGMGGNTAIMDAYHLAWKLAMVLRGDAGPGLLASHDPERRPYADLVVEHQYTEYLRTMRPDLDIAAPTVSTAALLFGYRHLSDAVVTEPDDDRALLEDPAQPTGRPGSRAPHAGLWSGLSTRDLFGHRFVLLAGPAWRAATEDAAKALDIELDRHDLSTLDTEYVVPPDGAVLVRPDGVIAWRALDATDPAGLARALRQVLDRPAP